jgi:hypothetical protein
MTTQDEAALRVAYKRLGHAQSWMDRERPGEAIRHLDEAASLLRAYVQRGREAREGSSARQPTD